MRFLSLTVCPLCRPSRCAAVEPVCTRQLRMHIAKDRLAYHRPQARGLFAGPLLILTSGRTARPSVRFDSAVSSATAHLAYFCNRSIVGLLTVQRAADEARRSVSAVPPGQGKQGDVGLQVSHSCESPHCTGTDSESPHCTETDSDVTSASRRHTSQST